MFWITLALCICVFLLGLEQHHQAQRAEARAMQLEVRQGLNFDWLKKQALGKKHVANMRPTVVVNYANGIPEHLKSSHDDDLDKTQCLEEADSGFRLRPQ